MARTLGQGGGMKRASFISRESSEQFMEFKTQVLKAYPGHPALESRWSGNPSPPNLPKTNMALDLPGWSGWMTASSPRFKASEDKYILQLKKKKSFPTFYPAPTSLWAFFLQIFLREITATFLTLQVILSWS